MPKIISFDMDGTIADLYAVPEWLAKLRAEDVSPYEEAPPMWDMEELRRVILALIDAGYEIRVISWLAKNSSPQFKAATRAAKRAWLERYNFPADKVHLIAYGRTKATALRDAEVECAVLVDDDRKVRQGWTLGDTIDPTATDNLPLLLESLYLTP